MIRQSGEHRIPFLCMGGSCLGSRQLELSLVCLVSLQWMGAELGRTVRRMSRYMGRDMKHVVIAVRLRLSLLSWLRGALCRGQWLREEGVSLQKTRMGECLDGRRADVRRERTGWRLRMW